MCEALRISRVFIIKLMITTGKQVSKMEKSMTERRFLAFIVFAVLLLMLIQLYHWRQDVCDFAGAGDVQRGGC